MALRKVGWRWWVVGSAGALWALSFYRAYHNLAIPAFGPASQATTALLELVLRYVLYFAAGGAAWLGIERILKNRRARQRRAGRERRTASSG